MNQQKDGIIIMQKALFSLFFFFVYTDKNYAYTTKNRTPSPYPSKISYVLQQIKPEGSQFKPQLMVCWAQGPDLVTRATVTSNNKEKEIKYAMRILAIYCMQYNDYIIYTRAGKIRCTLVLCAYIVHLKQYRGEQNIVYRKYLYLHMCLFYTVTDKQ